MVRMDTCRRGVRLTALAALCVVSLSACQPRPTPLADLQPTPEAVASEVLTALERRDESRLRALALSEQEFREHVWPQLPAARPERNLPMAYVWGDLKQKSDASLASTLAKYGGKHLALKTVRLQGEKTVYRGFVVERRSELTVVDDSGQELIAQLFGSIIQTDGGYKVFSFVVD